MNKLTRFALTMGVAALLADCNGSQPPIGAPGAMPPSNTTVQHGNHGASWMLPEASSDDLLYLSSGNVYVYSYPAGKQVGTLTGLGITSYECGDKSGNVFVTSVEGSNQGVYEFAHGGSQPINFLPLSGAWACSVDQTTGDLAVIQEYGGNAYVYRNAQGTPSVYNDSDIHMSRGVTYDNSGDLFIDGEYQNFSFALVELPQGTSNFKDISFQGTYNGDDYQPLAWDGKFLALGTQQALRKRGKGTEVVDRIQVNGSTGTVVGEVPLAQQRTPRYPQFVIYDGTAIDESDGKKSAYFAYFTYPGGKETKKVKVTGFNAIEGAALSLTASR